MSDNIRIVQKMKTVWKSDKISGHFWPEHTLLTGFEVHGGFFIATSHMTEKSAKAELDRRRSFNAKFPPRIPCSQREIDKARRLGINIKKHFYHQSQEQVS